MRAFYLSAGNFPSIAANALQIAKMASAYSRLLPGLKMVALSGVDSLLEPKPVDLQALYGLTEPLPCDYLPLLPSHPGGLFVQDYRPPQWFYYTVAHYAAWRGAELCFTRKPETALTAAVLGLPVILESHDPWEYFPALAGKWGRMNAGSLKGIVVVSDGLAANHASLGIPESRITVEPDGVDLDQYPQDVNRAALRAELGLGPRFACVYTGHLHRDRGIEHAIAAAALALDMDFVFVGGWPADVEHYRSLAAGLANVRFTGFVDHGEVARYQMAADALLMQYSADAHHHDRCSPLKLFEYMGAGRPLVATDLPVLSSVLRHCENCLLVPPGATTELVAALRRLRDEPGLGAGLAATARRDVEPLSWDARARRILNTFQGGV